MITRTLLAALAILAVPAGALAQPQSPTSLGSWKDWTAWSYSGAKGKVCYLHAKPQKAEPAKLNHGDVAFFVRRSPGEGIQHEANFVVGYPFKDASNVTITIDGKAFQMFTQGDSAWLVDGAQEAQLLTAMRSGKSMMVSGYSRRGNETTYAYSLSGISAANQAIDKACK